MTPDFEATLRAVPMICLAGCPPSECTRQDAPDFPAMARAVREAVESQQVGRMVSWDRYAAIQERLTKEAAATDVLRAERDHEHWKHVQNAEEVTRLRGEVEELRSYKVRGDLPHDTCDAEIERLRGALTRYGVHLAHCGRHRVEYVEGLAVMSPGQCDCGYSAALTPPAALAR